MMTGTDLTDAESGIAQHVIAHCLEGQNVNDHTDSDVEWDYRGWTIKDLDCHDGWVEVHATQQTTQSEKVRSATYYPNHRAHPAEYRTHDVTLYLLARTKWTADDPLAGQCHVDIEQEGGRPSPPDPDPYEV